MKTLLTVMILVSISHALLIWSGSKRFINWRIDRQADRKEQDTDLSNEVYDVITDTLTKAREGMNATDLFTASETVSSLADAHRKEVPAEEIDDLIKKIST
ncbi:unnamed protein product [Lymnaea stagnalis]|uniref:Uncharacterized protein n=1 Tax=Lymnaea stagnalis TaxID=6523 RepID=A0AAV2I860_LYMST